MYGPAHDSEQSGGSNYHLNFQQLLNLVCWNEVDDGKVKDDEKDESDQPRCCDASTVTISTNC